MENTEKHETKEERGAAKITLERLVMLDIKKCMKGVVADHPVNNSGSYPLTLLWQIFEAATERFEQWGEIKEMGDDAIEHVFHKIFPIFISSYPKVMELDA